MCYALIHNRSRLGDSITLLPLRNVSEECNVLPHPCFHLQCVIVPVKSLCNFHKWLQCQWVGGCRPSCTFPSLRYLFPVRDSSGPWGLGCLLQHLWSKFSTWQLHLKHLIGIPLLPDPTPRAALSAPLSADSPVHFTACDDLHVLPERREETWRPNLPHILLFLISHSESSVYTTELLWALNWDWLRGFFGLVFSYIYILYVGTLFLMVYPTENATFSIRLHTSLPSYSNLYLWNWFTLSESIPFLINQLSVDLYSGQRVKLSNIFCFNVLGRARDWPVAVTQQASIIFKESYVDELPQDGTVKILHFSSQPCSSRRSALTSIFRFLRQKCSPDWRAFIACWMTRGTGCGDSASSMLLLACGILVKSSSGKQKDCVPIGLREFFRNHFKYIERT